MCYDYLIIWWIILFKANIEGVWMQVKAAVAFEVGKPLAIELVQLEGPKQGRFSLKLRQQVFVTQMPSLYPVMIQRSLSDNFRT